MSADSGAADETETPFVCPSMYDLFLDDSVGSFTLEVDRDDIVDQDVRNLDGQHAQALKTHGDGACALHATFGVEDVEKREMRLEHPRFFFDMYSIWTSIAFAVLYVHVKVISSKMLPRPCGQTSSYPTLESWVSESRWLTYHWKSACSCRG